MRLLGASLIVLAALSAGCFDDSAPVSWFSPTGFEDSAPPAYALACPGGDGHREPAPGVCAGTLGNVAEFVGEPNVAVHPTRPGVVAVGVNSVSLAPRESSASPPSALPVFLGFTELRVTENGGASWRSVSLPTVPGRTHNGDPSLVFDAEGTLHFTELVANLHPLGTGLGVLYAASPDLGATWSRVIVLDDPESADRNWVSVADDGTVFITWQTTPPSTVVAWSRDGGPSWDRIERIQGCNLQTDVVAFPTGPVFACVQREGEDHFHTDVHRLDLNAKATSVLSRLPSPSGTLHLAHVADGSLALAGPFYADGLPSVRVYRSVDGGATWSVTLDVRALATADDAWDWIWPTWVEVDPWGALHVLVAGGFGESCFRGTCNDAPSRHEVAYFVLDPVAGRMLLESPLTPTAAEERPRDPAPLLPPLADDFHGIGFGPGGGFIAWGHDRAVDYARVERVDP